MEYSLHREGKVFLSDLGRFTKGRGITRADLVDTGTPCLRYGDIYTTYGDVTDELTSFVSADTAQRATPLHHGDIIFATSGETAEEIGKAVAWLGKGSAIAGSDTIILRDHGQDPVFLAHALNAHDAARQKSRLGKGHTVVHIHEAELRKVTVFLPPVSEQRKIGEILRTWDKAIDGITNLIKLLRSRREAMSYMLFSGRQYTVKKAFFSDFLKESRLPGSEGTVGRKITVKLYGKGAVPKVETRPGSLKTRFYRRTTGQLIYSKLDFLNGAFAILPELLNEHESSLDLPAFDISEQVNPKWLLEYLIRPCYFSRQLHLARGQRKARRIAPTDFLTSPIRLPDRRVQDHIANTLTSADDEITSQCSLLEMYNRQKKGLKEKFLTGIWRVDTTGPRLTRPKD